MTKLRYGLLAVLGVLLLSITVVGNIGGNEAELYDGTLEDLLFTEDELPGWMETILIEKPADGWEFVSVQGYTTNDGWTFISVKTPLDFTDYSGLPEPSDYVCAIFWHPDENGEPLETLTQLVMRYPLDVIEENFSFGDGWTFVPASGTEATSYETEYYVGVSRYEKEESYTYIEMRFAKKDVLVIMSYKSLTDFDPVFILEKLIEMSELI